MLKTGAADTYYLEVRMHIWLKNHLKEQERAGFWDEENKGGGSKITQEGEVRKEQWRKEI